MKSENKRINFNFEEFIHYTILFEMETHRPLSIKMNCVFHKGQPDEYRLTEQYIYLVTKLKIEPNFLTKGQKSICKSIGIDLTANESHIKTTEI